MSDCPAYLSIIINDRTAAEQLFNYDVMMPCPAHFNLTFTVPRILNSHTSQTFEVVLDDAKRVYRLLLTYFRSHGAAENDGSAKTSVAAEAYSSDVIQVQTSDVTKVVTACVMIVVICLSVRLLCDVTVLRREKPSVTADPDDVTQPYATGSLSTVNSRQRQHLVFVSVYVGFNVLYSLLVTFTAVSVIFLFCFRSEVDHVTTGGQRLGSLTRRAISDVEKMSERRLEVELQLAERRGRQVSKKGLRRSYSWHRVSERRLEVELQLAERRGRQAPVACTRYVDDMTDFVRQSVFNVTLRHYRQNSISVSGLMSAVINSTVADVERWVLKYVGELEKQIERRANPVRLHQTRYRRQVTNSVWLLYARSLFNRSTALASLTTSSSSSSSTTSSDAAEDEVVRFLEEAMSVHTASYPRWYKSAHLQRSVSGFCRNITT